MEINEKLDIFYQAAIDAAREQSMAIQEEYRNAYEDALAAYEKEKQINFRTRERILEEKIRKEVNRATSDQLIQLKKDYHEKEEQRKAELFSMVAEKLAAYRKTKAYLEYILNKIREAQDMAAGAAVKIYLDREDAALVTELRAKLELEPEVKQKVNPTAELELEARQKTAPAAGMESEMHCELLVSEEFFGGGIRAVIPAKNVLLDESFGSRFSQEQEKFSF